MNRFTKLILIHQWIKLSFIFIFLLDYFILCYSVRNELIETKRLYISGIFNPNNHNYPFLLDKGKKILQTTLLDLDLWNRCETDLKHKCFKEKGILETSSKKNIRFLKKIYHWSETYPSACVYGLKKCKLNAVFQHFDIIFHLE